MNINPNALKVGQPDVHDFPSSLVYKSSSRPVKVI